MDWTDARKAAWSEAANTWPADQGAPYVYADGWEDGGHFLVATQSLAYGTTGDPLAMLLDPPYYLVAKATGAVKLLGWEDAELRSIVMRRISSGE